MGVGGSIFWVGGGGWTLFMGERGWVGVVGGIFWTLEKRTTPSLYVVFLFQKTYRGVKIEINGKFPPKLSKFL